MRMMAHMIERLQLGLCLLVGTVEALLIGRLLAQLLAARPDNPAIGWLYALSDPLRAPLALLDAGQPRWGARLEFSTLVMAGIVLMIGYAVWHVLAQQAKRAEERNPLQ
jgi:hypothetical protein